MQFQNENQNKEPEFNFMDTGTIPSYMTALQVLQ